MKEDFLHFLWRYQKYDWSALTTTTGEPITLLHPGEPNPHAGPDFLNARIRLDGTLWAGNVEIHVLASEWNDHRHDRDPAYDNVILHVVLEEDKPILRRNGERIPCLELRNRIQPGQRRTYYHLLNAPYWIPCQPQLPHVDDFTKQLWLERLAIERLENRIEKFQELLNQNSQDWEETFYQAFARNLGHPANADPFEELARRTPLSLLRRKRANLRQLEALLFGQAGLLEGPFSDEYPKTLQEEYAFLRHQHKLSPMHGAAWKFLRMRPANFPTLRIAQLARLLHQTSHLFDKAMSANNLEEWERMLELKVSQYWRTHYRFDHPSPPKNKSLGKATVHQFLINTVAPFLFFYGAIHQNSRYLDRSIELLSRLSPEDNQVIRKWTELGLKPVNATQSQALLQLKKQYCEARQCLRCAIGHALLKPPKNQDMPENPGDAFSHSGGSEQ